MGLSVRSELSIFRRLNTNVSVRGVEQIVELRNAVEESLYNQHEDNPEFLEAFGLKELQQRYPADSARKSVVMGEQDGVYSFREFAIRTTRGVLFQELLLGRVENKEFETRPYVQTYKSVWRDCEENGLHYYGDCGPLTPQEIKSLLWESERDLFFDTKKRLTLMINFQLKNLSLYDGWVAYCPSLKVGKIFLGVRSGV